MTGPVGPRGLTVLLIVGIIGLALAIVGWADRGAGAVFKGSDRIAVYVVGTGAGR
jgi:hypothetical protein